VGKGKKRQGWWVAEEELMECREGFTYFSKAAGGKQARCHSLFNSRWREVDMNLDVPLPIPRCYLTLVLLIAELSRSQAGSMDFLVTSSPQLFFVLERTKR
jgi:hypothetical protein